MISAFFVTVVALSVVPLAGSEYILYIVLIIYIYIYIYIYIHTVPDFTYYDGSYTLIR